MALPKFEVTAPVVEPAKHNALDTLGASSITGHALGGVEYESDFCGMARLTTPPCEAPPETKTPDDGVSFTQSYGFTVYHLFRCRTLGQFDSAEERAKASLALGESFAVEAALQTQIAAMASTISGASFNPAEGLAELEYKAGTSYGGRAVIHVTRRVATLLASKGLIEVRDGVLQTILGSKVVAGGGYTGTDAPGATAAPPAGSEWMYVTGHVELRRGEVLSRPPVLGMSSGAFTNEFLSLAERVYQSTIDCFASGVLVAASVGD